MKILVACEESQAVTIELRKLGHEAYSCDIIECSGGHPEWHIKQDVISLLNGNCTFSVQDTTECSKTIWDRWDMIIAFPPCTYLCNTGTPHLNVEKYGEKAIKRLRKREEAFEFFKKIADANCNKIAIENPVGLPNSRYRKPDQIINPWQFGHPYNKKTCLWLKGLPKLEPFATEKPKNCRSYAFETMYDENGKTIDWGSERSKRLRSKTFQGIAKAMAEQWGGLHYKK
jgi:hypothetical protein